MARLTAAAAAPALVVIAALVACAGAEAPRYIDFNPWSWIPTNRNRSPSIMDYFFPPSRTPKQSTLEPPADRQPPNPQPKSTTIFQKSSVAETALPTTVADDPTTVARKATTKTKSTVTMAQSTATIPPKTKKTTNKNTDTTIDTKTTHPSKYSVTSRVTTTRPTKQSMKPVKKVEATTVAELTTYDDDSTESTEASQTTAEVSQEVSATSSTSQETDAGTASTAALETTTEPETTASEPVDSREGYLPLKDSAPHTNVQINQETKKETVPLPAGSTSVLAKPTKYHYYPHNQHIYLLPECAIQQVCNAVYVRLNYTQPLCACPSRYRDPCSASLNADDLHTTRLTTDSKKKFASKAVTLVKTCEAVSEMRECRAPRDWSLLALQNIRTGKSHYLVICRCPENHILEGPMSHDQPTYASVPGIRVYGMMCVKPTTYSPGYNSNRYPSTAVQSTTSAYKVEYSQPHSYDKPLYNRLQTQTFYPSYYSNRKSRVARIRRMVKQYLPFPWEKVQEFARTLEWV